MDKAKEMCFKTVPLPGRQVYDIPADVKEIINMANSLSSKNFEILCLELMKNTKLSKEQIVKVKNLLIAEEKRARKAQGSASIPGGSTEGSGQPSMVDPRPAVGPGLELAAPASKVPFIVRSDLAAAVEVLALDTEKITTTTHKPVSGDVAIVDLKGRLVFWAYIYRRNRDVCRYNTAHTGLTRDKLEMGVPLEVVHAALQFILKGKTVAGFKIKDDFDSLEYSTTTLPDGLVMCELQKFFIDEDGDAIKLSQLAIHFLGSNPQDGAHSSIRDARVTAICYKRMIAFKAIGMAVYKCTEFDAFRRVAKKDTSTSIWEPCRCGLTKTKKNKPKARPQMFLYSIDDQNISDFD